MGCEHTVATLLQASSFASAGDLVTRARNDAFRQKMGQMMEEQRRNQEHFQKMNAITGHGVGIPLLNAGQSSHVSFSDAQAATPTESGKTYNLVKDVVRTYGFYELDHHVVFDALIQVLGNLPMGASAAPADALAFAAMFGVVYRVVSLTDSLPDFSSNFSGKRSDSSRKDGGENLNKLLVHASHFISIDDENVAPLAQKIAKDREVLRLAIAFLKLVCFQKRPSAAVVDIAVSTFMYLDPSNTPDDMRQLGTGIFPLAQFVPYVLTVRALSNVSQKAQDCPIVTMLPDGRISADGVIYSLIGFSQRGLVLIAEDRESGPKDSTNDVTLRQFGVEFHVPYVVVAQSPATTLSNVCGACQLPMERFKDSDFLCTSKSALVTADLRTTSNVRVSEGGKTEFSADGLIWDKRFERVIRMNQLEFEADVFELHNLMPLAHERLSALVPSAPMRSEGQRTKHSYENSTAIPAPFPTCHQVSAHGLQVMSVLAQASDYVVDQSGRIVSVQIAGTTLYAARDDNGVMKWSRKAANHAFTLCDVV